MTPDDKIPHDRDLRDMLSRVQNGTPGFRSEVLVSIIIHDLMKHHSSISPKQAAELVVLCLTYLRQGIMFDTCMKLLQRPDKFSSELVTAVMGKLALEKHGETHNELISRCADLFGESYHCEAAK